jgi:hypothetical protein
MKRFVATTAYILFLSACIKDKGDYDYREINEVTITGLQKNYATVFGRDTLRLKPTLTMTESITDPARLSYYWILYTGTTPIDTIGREPLLEWPVEITPADYNLFLRIADNQTEMVWKAGTTVTVGTRYSMGIMLMGTGETGHAEMDMITMVNDTAVVTGILSKSGLPALYDPVGVQHVGGNSNNNNARLWVMTKSGSYYLDRLTMLGNTENKFAKITVTNEIANKETITPIVFAPQIIARNGATGSGLGARAWITTDGDIFPTHTFLAGGDFYPNPVNRLETDFSKRLKAAPFFWYAIASLNALIWYDTDNNRFLNFVNIGINTFSNVLTDKVTDPFPWTQTGRTLVYGENTRNTDGGSTNGNSFAIMKDGSGKHYIYKFYANGATPQKRDLYEVSPIAIDFDKATSYAFSSRRSVIFYSVGTRLYAYDYNKGFEKFYSFPEITDEITMLKFDTQIDYTTNALYVATYNGKGRLRRFMVGTDPNTVTISPVDRSDWNGLVKIKDMSWRAFN